MFSYEHYGALPGLDIAFLLDGAAYHTDRDAVGRIRRGTLQAGIPPALITLAQFALVAFTLAAAAGDGGEPALCAASICSRSVAKQYSDSEHKMGVL